MRIKFTAIALVLVSTLVHLNLLAADGGRIEYGKMPVSQLRDFTEREYAVYLPASYDTDRTKTYPVLYLLHGGFGSFLDWPTAGNLKETADRMIAEGRIEEIVIICPDGRYRDNTMWFDIEDWTPESHFFDEFIPFMEGHYRIRSDKAGRSIAGLSLGGGAAIGYAMDRPDMFVASVGLTAYLRSVPEVVNPRIEWIQPTVDSHNPILRLESASPNELSKWKNVAWMMDCGDNDFTLPSNVEFDAAMNQQTIPHTFIMRKGMHDWKYWNESLPIVLDFLNYSMCND